MLTQLYEVRPGPSSQTTSAIEEIIVQDSLSLKFFDVNSLHIETIDKDIWNDTAGKVFQAHVELWERLAEL